MSFTHLDASGHARMVDVTGKQPTVRSATARGFVRCAPEIVAALRDGTVPKGDVLAVARIAGIQAAKRTPELLPLAHVIGVHGAAVELEITPDGVEIEATVRTADRTGVEMEALTAVAVAGLAVIDMVKGSTGCRRSRPCGSSRKKADDRDRGRAPHERRRGHPRRRTRRTPGRCREASPRGRRPHPARGRSHCRACPRLRPPHGRRSPVEGVDGVLWAREDPPFGGPAAAVVAGLRTEAATDPEWTLVLAADLPRAVEAVLLLRDSAALHPADIDGVCLADAAGRPQWLTALYRTAALRRTIRSLGADGRDAPARALADGLAIATVADPDGRARDVDTWEDLDEARAYAAGASTAEGAGS